MATIAEHVDRQGLVLADGGIETRVMFDADLRFDPDIGVAAMVDDPVAGPRLRDVYAGYLAVAARHGLPAVIGTPTFRASVRYTALAGRGGDAAVRSLNAAAARFHRDIRQAAGAEPVWIAGVIGPAGDAYLPHEALSSPAAARYHQVQCDALAEAGCDFLFAATFPAVDEAIGAVRAMSETGLAAVLSLVLDGDGAVLDGTSLADAIDHVDRVQAPAWYSLSCIHPAVAHRALASAGDAAERVREVKANASALTPDELVQLDHPVADPPEEWAAAMWGLRQDFGVAVLGGCCGTDDRHLEALAGLMAGSSATGASSAAQTTASATERAQP